MNKKKLISILKSEKYMRSKVFAKDPQKMKAKVDEMQECIDFCEKAIPGEGQVQLF